MSSRRAPLAENPNAVNSPIRIPAAKRPRLQTNDTEDHDGPSKKRRLFELETGNGVRVSVQETHPKPSTTVTQRASQQYKSLHRKQENAREVKQSRQRHGEREIIATKEELKQWRIHYKNLFPKLVFYFESVSPDVQHRVCKQIALLGAREEKFFSRSVTHVVTTRTIPASAKEVSPSEQFDKETKTSSSKSQQVSSQTINPSLLDRLVDSKGNIVQPRSRTIVEAEASKRPPIPWQDAENRKSNHNAADVLYKAQDLGMKIWALEKFDRMMSILLPDDRPEDRTTRSHPPLQTARGLPIASKDVDLSQLLRQEKQNAVVERQAWQDIVPFKGHFIYVSDMDEKVRPIMVREYTKPDDPLEGEWPMLHPVSQGRCPFVPEMSERKKKERKAQQEKLEQEKQQKLLLQQEQAAKALTVRDNIRQTRSASKSPQKVPLCELDANQMAKPLMPAPSSKPFVPPKLTQQTSVNLDSMPFTLGSARADFRGIAKNPGGEPLASGLRPSVTSAIRSQMISSAAATAPGSRAGTSKQMHQLQRQVLERHSGLSGNTVPSSHINDLRAAINSERGPALRRTSRQKARETMTRIYEDETLSEEEDAQRSKPTTKKSKKKEEAKNEPKPGYCENCRDKYDDFNEHTESKAHKKFALDPRNWMELDALLVQLQRR